MVHLQLDLEGGPNIENSTGKQLIPSHFPQMDVILFKQIGAFRSFTQGDSCSEKIFRLPLKSYRIQHIGSTGI
ncbi:MAG TPA: hypothetical protein VJL58_04255, partial [Pyrinomonadaceae bacterium]|nr:hypothetical protein [Pyrinomonadaceae bacterium]